MTWEHATLGEIIELSDHIRVPLNSAQRAERQGPYPYYGAQGVIDHIDDYLFDGRYLLVPEDGENLNSRKLPIAFFASGRFWVNNHAHILRARAGIADDEFLKHWLNNANISGYVTGAAQPKLSQQSLRRIQLSLPPLVIQRRIASILSAYDDLIEINTCRIAILEEMGRRLFDQWFVRHQFPRSVSVPLVETPLGSLPADWSITPLETYCQTITDGSHWSPASTPSGKLMASVKDMREWGFDFTECRRISEADFQTLVRNGCKPKPGDILIAKDGAKLNKHTFLMTDDTDLVLLSSVAIIRPNPGTPPEFLLALLKSDPVSDRIKRSVSGAAIPRIILKDFKRLPLPAPPSKLQRRWAGVAEPIHTLCRELSKTNVTLCAARDLLLPKLISGEIDFERAARDAEAITERAAAE